MKYLRLFLTCSTTFLLATGTTQAAPIALQLPTVNDAIFSKNPEKFYMYCHRTFEGKTSKPWTAGQYGFVRTLRRTQDGVIATKFHEGIDIAPLKRDKAGRPLDIVHAISHGKVVHCNTTSGHSNYGKYVVIEHNWDAGPFYSLYAHLSDVSIKVGASVKPGTPIGKLGYTGVGLDRTRAHLHLELNIKLSERYGIWHDKHFGSANYHGTNNGINLAGLNIAELYLRHNKNPRIELTDFLQNVPVHYKVTVPSKGQLDITKRYPWLLKHTPKTAPQSWEISFASSGFPLAVIPSQRSVTKPTVTAIKATQSNHSYHTKGILTGSGTRASLTTRGKRFIELLTGHF